MPSNAAEPISSGVSVLTLARLAEFEVLQACSAEVKLVHCPLLSKWYPS